MVIKLYKKDGTRTLYWEGFDWEKKAAFRQGVVGHDSEPEFVKPKLLQSASKIIKSRAAEMKSQGYAPVEPADHFSLVIQYRIQGFGTEGDLDRRNKVEEAIHDQLGIMGGGHVDGGDIGSGTMNVFCYVIEPDAVLPGILERLKKEDMLEGAIIAINPPGSDSTPRVVWPKDFAGEFRIL